MNKLLLKGLLATFLLVITCTIGVMAQERVISGTVVDGEDNSPLPGVSILVKGTSNGTVTGIDGMYSISVSDGAVLVFSFVGYESQEIAVGSSNSINVSMGVDVVALEEIVVIGYGTQKKEDLTGAVTAIGTEDFNKGVISSPQELLMGRTSGVQITTGGGAPGTGATIRIRGGSSLSASNDPLIVVDGVPVGGGTSGMRNPLNTINPNDIETFTVLKDASATAIYGSRASNGVIIITTKRGSTDKPSFSYNGSFTLNTLPRQLDVLDAAEFGQVISDRIANGDLDSSVAGLVGSANTDWQSEVLQNSRSMDHNFSMTGAIADIPIRASIGYTDQNGILKTSSMERATVSIGLDPSFLNDNLKMKVNFKGSSVNNRFADWGAIRSAILFDPTQPVYDSESPWGGYFYWDQSAGQATLSGDPNLLAPANPVALLDLVNNTSSVYKMIGNVELKYTLPSIPELTATLNLGTERSDTEGVNITQPTAAWTWDPVIGNGTYGEYAAVSSNDLLEMFVNYNKDMGDHSISLLGGYSWQRFWGEGFGFTENFARDYVYSEPDTSAGENFLVSFFGRVNYNYKGKYLLTATLRNDGSSKFSEENRWGLFPSAAFAWSIDEEDFMSDIDVISNLKLRIGYGVTGQQDIGSNYAYLPAVNFSNPQASYQFGNTFYRVIRYEAFDTQLKWEETTTLNVGLDFGLMSDRINGSLEYYQRTTDDLLNTVPIPIGTNFSNFLTTNIGSLTIDGFEFQIDARVIESPDFSWDFGMNMTAVKNEITKLTLVEDPNYLGVLTGGIGGGVGSTIQVHSVGFPRNSFFALEQIYDEAGFPIEGLFIDQNDDGIINDSDRVRWEDPTPDMFLGFSSRFKYKDFDLAMNARMNVGSYVYDNVSSQYSVYQNLWYPTNYLNNLTSTISLSEFEQPHYTSNFYLNDASFFRMDNISLGYYIGNRISDSFDASVRLTVQNAFFITKYDGLDPEIFSGIDNTIYPRPRTFLLGLSVNF